MCNPNQDPEIKVGEPQRLTRDGWKPVPVVHPDVHRPLRVKKPWPVLVECPKCGICYRMLTPETQCPYRGLKQHRRPGPEGKIFNGDLYEKFDRPFDTKEGAQQFADSEFRSTGTNKARVVKGTGIESAFWFVYWLGL